MSETIEVCSYCKSEYEIKYSTNDGIEIVSQTRCKCVGRVIQSPKELDQALLKLKGLLNEKRFSGNESLSTNQPNPIKD